jgi:hypothetical protein
MLIVGFESHEVSEALSPFIRGSVLRILCIALDVFDSYRGAGISRGESLHGDVKP